MSAADAGEDDVAGQVFVHRPEAVEQPRPDARIVRADGAGVEEGVGGIVVDLIGDHGLDHADVIGEGLDVGEEVADFDAALAAFLKGCLWAESGERFALELGDGLPGGDGLGHGVAVLSLEFRFVVEGFEMARPARHAEVDDAFCTGEMVWELRHARHWVSGGGEQARARHAAKGERPE